MMADRARHNKGTNLGGTFIEGSSPVSPGDLLHSKGRLDSYRLRRNTNTELDALYVKDDYSLTQRKFGQGGKAFKTLIPNKEYLSKKRMSRDVTGIGLSGLTSPGPGSTRLSQRSRKSISPQSGRGALNQGIGATHSAFHQQPHYNFEIASQRSQKSNEQLDINSTQALNNVLSATTPALNQFSSLDVNMASAATPLQRIPSESSSTFLDLSQPLVQKERILIICRVENDGEIKENKPIYIPRLHWQKDLKLSVLGPNDVKVLHNSIQQGVNMIAVSCVESKDDLTYVKKIPPIILLSEFRQFNAKLLSMDKYMDCQKIFFKIRKNFHQIFTYPQILCKITEQSFILVGIQDPWLQRPANQSPRQALITARPRKLRPDPRSLRRHYHSQGLPWALPRPRRRSLRPEIHHQKVQHPWKTSIDFHPDP